MALIHALMRLKDYGLVKNFEFVDRSEEKAKVVLANEQQIIVYMAEDSYILTYIGIQNAWEPPPVPDYIIYNQWDKVTRQAHEKANSQGVNLVSFGEFHRLLMEMINNK